MKMLIERKADVHGRTFSNSTPLMAAAYDERLEALQVVSLKMGPMLIHVTIVSYSTDDSLLQWPHEGRNLPYRTWRKHRSSRQQRK